MKFKTRIKQQFSRAAAHYDEAAQLQYQCAQELAVILPNIQPQRILDVGTGTGYGIEALQNRYPQAILYGIDLSHAMLLEAQKKVSSSLLSAADFDSLPFADQSIDFIFSSLAWQWSPDFKISLNEAARVLKPGGTLLFSTFTAGSLRELHAKHFLTETVIRSTLQQTGFILQAHFLETRRQYFTSAKAVLDSLKKIGASAQAEIKHQDMNARTRLKHLEALYPKDEKGYPLTYKILFISARRAP
jgi:malonyl-CoA O-methyltransferase